MNLCPDCQSKVEPWEVVCRSCGKSLSAEPVIPASDDTASSEDLDESSRQWENQARDKFAQERFEACAADCLEALRRLKGLADAGGRELGLRLLLAEALEKAGKPAEAAREYRLLTEQQADAGKREIWQSRAKELEAAAAELMFAISAGGALKAPAGLERKYAPLYCQRCTRLFNEGEIFGYRKGKVTAARCLCGFEGQPLVKLDRNHARLMREAERVQGRRAKLIEAAGRAYPGGKNKYVAAVLALFFGFLGIHKLYLGERGAFFLHLALCWTLIPLALGFMDAVLLFSMSDVSFNLSYNVDRVLASIPPEELKGEVHDDLFSMEVTEDPEDFVDEFTEGGGAAAFKKES